MQRLIVCSCGLLVLRSYRRSEAGVECDVENLEAHWFSVSRVVLSYRQDSGERVDFLRQARGRTVLL